MKNYISSFLESKYVSVFLKALIGRRAIEGEVTKIYHKNLPSGKGVTMYRIRQLNKKIQRAGVYGNSGKLKEGDKVRLTIKMYGCVAVTPEVPPEPEKTRKEPFSWREITDLEIL